MKYRNYMMSLFFQTKAGPQWPSSPAAAAYAFLFISRLANPEAGIIPGIQLRPSSLSWFLPPLLLYPASFSQQHDIPISTQYDMQIYQLLGLILSK